MIRGQCMQVILDQMNHDPDWYTTIESYYPLTLIKLIEKTILAQTKYQYWYATVYNQECIWYGFNQKKLTNEQYYKQFNYKVDDGEAIGITIQHRILMEDMAQKTFRSLMTLVHMENWK